MSYIIVNNEQWQYKKRGHISSAHYATKAAANASLHHLTKRQPNEGWHVVEYTTWREAHPVKMVTRKNLMSGIEYQEAEDTPLCSSPASETYWST